MGTPTTTQLAPGLEISRVLTGLWQVADMERGGETLDPERGAEALSEYVDRGLTTFDMADHYGSAELIAGAYNSRGGAPAQMLTKWVPEPGPARREDAVEAVDRALRRLRTERIDLLQFHAWNYGDPSWLDLLFWLDELRREGKILHLGMTNCDAAHLQMALESGVPLVSNQVCYSLLDSRPKGPMTRVCAEYGVGLLAYGTLAGGFLSDRWIGAAEPEIDERLSWSQMKYRRFIDQAGGWARLQDLLRSVKAVADRLGVSVANVACRYVLEQPGVAGIILGARIGERAYVEETLRLFDFALDEEARAALDEATSRLDPIGGGCGDEYRRPPFLTAAGDLSHHLTSLPDPYPTRMVGDAKARVHRNRVGRARRVQSCRTPRRPDLGVRNHGDPRPTGDRGGERRGPDPLHHRQDRRIAPIPGREPEGRDPHAHLRPTRGGLGGRVPGPRRPLRRHLASEHPDRGEPGGGRVPGGDGGRGRGVLTPSARLFHAVPSGVHRSC